MVVEKRRNSIADLSNIYLKSIAIAIPITTLGKATSHRCERRPQNYNRSIESDFTTKMFQKQGDYSHIVIDKEVHHFDFQKGKRATFLEEKTTFPLCGMLRRSRCVQIFL